ncbi:MAG TPA: helix-turn-helix transcriptional regulator [Ktedonobacteraceae bacterium]|nr:helix-turn-helix transcriptional regulator [Ktedonobacteraceae bacterium]
MPRPPKHVPPETLGGRIRAARSQLRLSLAHVAANRYSTSLISQIERNRVEPSYESLQFLADQLQLPFDELLELSQQHKESEAEARQYKAYDELREESARLLANQHITKALTPLQALSMSQMPSSLRWRLAALRGQCYFSQRHFLDAQKDFLYAVTEKPQHVPEQQRLEAMTLHLHLAAAYRELQQLKPATEHYTIALRMMDTSTSILHVAEAQWGLSLVDFELANSMSNDRDAQQTDDKEMRLRSAIEYATNACALYRCIGDTLHAALLTCQIGLIEQARGKLDVARQHLRKVLDEWLPTLEAHPQKPADQRQIKERKEQANIVSAVACSLAGIELDTGDFEHALQYVHVARQAAKNSYIIRKAEAEMMLGRILEKQDVNDPKAEEAFHEAVRILDATDRLAARIRAHELLGRHLLRKGDAITGEAEFDTVNKLAGLVTFFNSTPISGEDEG